MDTNDLKKIATSALISGTILAASAVSAMSSNDSSTFIDKNGNEQVRTKCEIYTRVMGYYRPVTQFNNGKKSEFYTRKYFNECTTDNSQFSAQFQA